MATTVAPVTPRASASSLPRGRYDHYFFSGIAALMLVTVIFGFGPTYYFVGTFRAPLPSTLVHVHAVIFSCWMLLLIAQTSLVSAGRVDIHRKLGIVGLVLAGSMIIVGPWAATKFLARDLPPGHAIEFYIVPLKAIFIFATLIVFAYRARSNPQAHKRLILIANTALMTAAIARLPFIHHNIPVAHLASYTFLLLLIGYDLFSWHKIHRATLWASAFLVTVHQVCTPISHTAAWESFARWAQTLAR